MPGLLPIDDVISKTLRGIARAQKDYEYWTDSYWLQEAPEYMTTVYVAREICKTKDRGYYLTLESNARQTLRDAGGIGKAECPRNHALAANSISCCIGPMVIRESLSS